jgi:hypothetical protein
MCFQVFESICQGMDNGQFGLIPLIFEDALNYFRVVQIIFD